MSCICFSSIGTEKLYTSGMYTFFLIFIPLFVLLSDFPSIRCALAALIGLNYCALRNKEFLQCSSGDDRVSLTNVKIELRTCTTR